MAEVIRCDRCGKATPKLLSGVHVDLDIGKLYKMQLSVFGFLAYRADYLDLCPDCAKSFWNWMRGEQNND